LTVLARAAAEINAHVENRFDRDGFCCEIIAPLTKGIPLRDGGRAPASARPAREHGAAQAPIRPAFPARGLRVLVVEDELLIALQLESELAERGYRIVGPAQSLEEGLDLTRSERFDAAVLDINLGEESSLPIAEELAAAGTPFAFMTGYPDTLLIPPHLRTIPAIRKPFQVEALLGLLQELAGRPAAGRRAQPGAGPVNAG